MYSAPKDLISLTTLKNLQQYIKVSLRIHDAFEVEARNGNYMPI